MSLLLRYFASEIDELDEKNVRILILGDVAGLPAPQRDAVERAMARTKDNTGLKLNIALNYGGRAELVRAARRLAERVQSGEVQPGAIDEAAFARELYTAGQPGRRSADPNQRRTPPVQLPAMADGLCGDGVRQDLLAGL